jgi:hypothetical protein
MKPEVRYLPSVFVALLVGIGMAQYLAAHMTIGATIDGGMSADRSPARIATLQHSPQFILNTVAQRMGIALRPEVPPPTILLESTTSLQRFQEAAERQWGFRPQVFVSAYAVGPNEIYVIDDAAEYLPYNRTLDDALAHEFVHYVQAKYFNDEFKVDWSEAEAILIQTWFREQYMEPRRTVTVAQPMRSAQ